MKVRITRLLPDVELPIYQTEGSAAFDLSSCEDVTIGPREHRLLPTGLIFGLPENHVLMVFPRSSTFKKTGLMMPHSAGIIDSDYCGPEDQTMLYVYNPGDMPVSISKGQRIAQGLVMPVVRAEFEAGQPADKNRGGFGSTG